MREGTLLKALLRQRYWQPYRQFCREYDKVAKTIDRRLVGAHPSESTYKRWLSGRITGVPRSDSCLVLQRMFPEHSVEELFGVEEPCEPYRREDTGHEGATTEDGEPVQRRDFLRTGSAVAVGGLFAPELGADTGGRVSADVVEQLRRRLIRLRNLDNYLGGADTYELYAVEAQVSARLLDTGVSQESLRRELLALYAEQAQQAGWSAFDAGWHDIAREHYKQSHSAATEAGEPGLAGNALAHHAYQLIALDRPAREISERSVHAAQQIGVDPGVRALLHSRAAWTFALDGDVDATARTIGLAEEALAHRTGETPDYAAWVDEIELAVMTGRCWSELRRPLRAVPILEEALTQYSDAHARDKALYSSWLAASYIDAGEIEQAAAIVRSSLKMMSDVASVRPQQRLAAVASRLIPYRHLSAVRDLLSSDALHPRGVRR